MELGRLITTYEEKKGLHVKRLASMTEREREQAEAITLFESAIALNKKLRQQTVELATRVDGNVTSEDIDHGNEKRRREQYQSPPIIIGETDGVEILARFGFVRLFEYDSKKSIFGFTRTLNTISQPGEVTSCTIDFYGREERTNEEIFIEAVRIVDVPQDYDHCYYSYYDGNPEPFLQDQLLYLDALTKVTDAVQAIV